jgi:hypothetical protein
MLNDCYKYSKAINAKGHPLNRSSDFQHFESFCENNGFNYCQKEDPELANAKHTYVGLTTRVLRSILTMTLIEGPEDYKGR